MVMRSTNSELEVKHSLFQLRFDPILFPFSNLTSKQVTQIWSEIEVSRVKSKQQNQR